MRSEKERYALVSGSAMGGAPADERNNRNSVNPCSIQSRIAAGSMSN